MRKIHLSIIIVLFFVSKVHCVLAQTETITDNGVTYVKIGNGMNALLVTSPDAVNTELSLYIRTGSIYDPDSTSGISNLLQNVIAAKINAYLQNRGVISQSNTKFVAYTTTEHSIYKFSVPTVNLLVCFKLINDSIFSARISEQELKKAKVRVNNDFEADSLDQRKQFGNKVLRILYRQDYEKLNIKGNPSEFENIDTKVISKFYEKYYVPNNSFLSAYSSYTYVTFQQKFESSFINLIKSEFNPESVTKIVDLRPMVYTQQFVLNDEATASPEFQLSWQFPGTSSNQQSSYCAFLLSAILNDKNNFIHVKANRMGCKKLLFEYESNNFSGVLRVTVQPDKANMQATIDFITTEMARIDQTLINETMLNAGKLEFKREYEALRNSKDYPEWIIKYWAFEGESYFTVLGDTLMSIKERDMRSFVIEYLKQSPHVTGLLINESDRAELKVDSFFTDVDERVGQYKFYYRPNIADLEGQENQIMLNNLLQFLKVNRDVNLQVNGYSDEGEYNQMSDDSISQFMDSLPDFRRTMPEKIKKGYLKPEMMRAMKLIKFFYDNGIESYRLSGTSMKFTSSDNSKAEENMKCTVSLDKLRKAPSSYEFHYGKPKPKSSN